MKKIGVYFVFLLLFHSHLIAQDINLPPYVDLLEGVKLWEYYDYNKLVPFCLSKIRMWGWSRNGKAAYSIEFYVDGRGGTITTAIIFDFIDDRIVWENKIDSFYTDYDINGFYNNFRAACKNYNIENINASFNNFPLKYKENIYNINIDVVSEENTENDWYDSIKSFQIVVETQGRSKIINSTNDIVATGIFPCGYFISPFENRALIIIGKSVRAFEGEDIEFIFIGCHLLIGFDN
jgi:hypothetical protein